MLSEDKKPDSIQSDANYYDLDADCTNRLRSAFFYNLNDRLSVKLS